MNNNNISLSLCTLLFLLFIILSLSSSTLSSSVKSNASSFESLCQNVSCRAGRECRILRSGLAECVCVKKCPPLNRKKKKKKEHHHHRRRWICGSDGQSYESHCDLHRQACLSGKIIRPVHGDKSCLKDPLIKLKKMIEKAAQELKEKEILVPAACNQNERNRMREFLMSSISLNAFKQQRWYKKNMRYHSILWHTFDDMDSDNNTFVDSNELLAHVSHKRQTKRATPENNAVIIELQLEENSNNVNEKKLCLDALVEEGDTDKDWRLSRSEFLYLLNHHYRPSDKYCIKDRRMYEDSTTIKVDCNGCICACGKWICTSKSCSIGTKPQTSDYSLKDDFVPGEEEFTYDDMDNQIE